MDYRHSNPNILAVAACSGLLGYLHLISLAAMVFAYLLPLLLNSARTAKENMLIAVAFALGSTAGLIYGISVLASLPVAILTWVTVGILTSLPFALLRRKAAQKRNIIKFTLVLLLITVPPFGYISSASPLLAASVIFPGAGMIGLFAGAGVFWVLYSAKIEHSFLLVLILLTYAAAVPITPRDLTSHEDYLAQSLMLGSQITADRDFALDHTNRRLLYASIKNKTDITQSTVIFPEGVAGMLTRLGASELIEYSQESNLNFIVGAEGSSGDQLNNVLLHITPKDARVIYQQRLPAPWFMWRGSIPGYFKADFSRPATYQYGNDTLGFLICYELATTWLPIETHLANPDIVIAASNLWWARGTNIPTIFSIKAMAWSRLFATPYLFSVNT